jgi:hypothetical protein
MKNTNFPEFSKLKADQTKAAANPSKQHTETIAISNDLSLVEWGSNI